MPDYINLTTDLRDLYPKVEQYQGRQRLTAEDFTLSSGQNSTYEARGVGYVEQVFDNGTQLTTQTSIADVESNAGSFYYDSDVDILYIQSNDSDALDSDEPPIEIGVDWDAFKERMRDDAQEELDAILNPYYVTPLLPRLRKDHSSNDYESWIRRATSALTIRNILQRLDPDNTNAMVFHRMVYNAEPEVGEDFGILDKVKKRDLVRQEDITPREQSGFNVFPKASTTGQIHVMGQYAGASREVWRLQIDTAGAPGTATWKLSYDTGTNFDKTLQDTFKTTNNERWIHIGDGIYVYFYGTTFAEGDYWDIEVYPIDEPVTNPAIGVIELIKEPKSKYIETAKLKL